MKNIVLVLDFGIGQSGERVVNSPAPNNLQVWDSVEDAHKEWLVKRKMFAEHTAYFIDLDEQDMTWYRWKP